MYMKNRNIILLLIVALITTSCAQTKVEVSTKIDEPTTITLKGGPEVDIPINALSKESNAVIEFIEEPLDAESGDYQIVGDVFDFSVPESPEFNEIVTLKIPYDPKSLPEDTPEANLFAVYLVDGEWVRLYGDVDEEANIILVQTLHNGIYSTAFDNIVDLGVETRQYLGIMANPTNIELARAEVAEREAEVLREWNLLQFRVEQYQESLTGKPLRDFVEKNFWETFTLTAADGLAYGLAGESGLLTLGGHTVGAWGGAIALGASSGLYIGPILGNSVLELRSMYRWIDARVRLEEARAVLQSLEHPSQTDFYGGQGELINNWTEIQVEVNPEGMDPINWSVSTVPIEPELSVEFEVDELDIVLGQCAVLKWDVTGGYSRRITINDEFYDLQGSVEICPEQTSSFDLAVFGRFDELLSAPESLTVNVETDPIKIMCFQYDLTDEECINAGKHVYEITRCKAYGSVTTCWHPTPPNYTFSFHEGGCSVSRTVGSQRNFDLDKVTQNEYSDGSVKIIFNLSGFTLYDGPYIMTYGFK